MLEVISSTEEYPATTFVIQAFGFVSSFDFPHSSFLRYSILLFALLAPSKSAFDTPALDRYRPLSILPPGAPEPQHIPLSAAPGHRRFELVHAPPSVLIVDRSEETRVVLETALEKRGIRALSACRVHRGAEIARKQRPDLIVLDLELDRSAPDALYSQFGTDADRDGPPMVLLGSMRITPPNPQSEIVSKPYHYGPLIRRIEEILGLAMDSPETLGCHRCL